MFRAQDLLQRKQVAVKLFRVDAKVDRSHLIDEFETLKKLDHPNIATALDYGTTDGIPFFVMEYVDGPSLSQLINEGQVSTDEAINWTTQVADAIHYAHERGLTHRDIKPANILLDAERKPYVVDFGFALHESEQHEHYGDRSGTPYYRSPEQVRGQADWIDGRADVWAIGVVLYESLTSRRPFNGSSLEEIDRQILERAPKPPRQIDSDIPEWLEEVCLKCLEKEPQDRIASATSLSESLRARGRKPRIALVVLIACLLYTSPSPRDATLSRMPSSA